MLPIGGAVRAYAAIAALSVLAGLFVVADGYVAVAGGAAFTMLGVAVGFRPEYRNLAATQSRERVLIFALVAYLAPLFILGRSFALVGYNPIYLPDVLIALAALLMLPRVMLRAIAPVTLLCTCVALLALHSVYAGISHGFPEATKGLVLVVYPLLAVVVAGWLAGHENPDRLFAGVARNILPLAAAGPLLVAVSGGTLIPATHGLYLGLAASFAAAPGIPRRRLLALSALVGLGFLVAFKPERGPVLAVLLASMGAWVAGARGRSHVATGGVTAGVLAIVASMTLAVSAGLVSPTKLPVAGPLIARTVASPSDPGVEATNNVTLRKAMWSYALRTTRQENPLLGMGAFHPVELTAFGNDIGAQSGAGVHNSFIGYVFYAGYPAGALVVVLFVMGMWRVWRIRHVDKYAPALFGALIAVVSTALTNVALETTYIGGPSWLVLAAAFGLAGWHRSERSRGGSNRLLRASASCIR